MNTKQGKKEAREGEVIQNILNLSLTMTSLPSSTSHLLLHQTK
jgi:hypothetical protein